MKRLIVIMFLCLCVNAFAIDGWIQQNTNETVILGGFYDDIDGVTAETGLTVTYTEVLLSKDGAAMAAKAETTSLADGTAGFYTCLLNTTDTATLGILLIHVNESGAGPVTQSYMVVATNVYGAMTSDARTLSVTAVANLEDTFDGTGYFDDVAPATQVQVATLAGGIALRTAATGINIDEPNGGEQTQTYEATTTHDGSYHEVASDDAGNDIDFYYTFNTGDGDNLPVDFHFVGYYEDNNAPANSTMVIQVYDFTAVGWVTIATLTDSSGDVNLDLPLNVHDVDPSGGTEGEVRIRFNLTTPEVTQNVRIDYANLGFVSGAGGLTAAAVVNEWETQSQADPTGFHINLLEVEGVDATTYWESRSLAAAAYFLFGSDTVARVTLVDTTTANSDMVGEPSTALSDINLDHLINIAVNTDLNTTMHDNSVLGFLYSISDVAAYTRTTDSIQAQQENPQGPPIID